MGYQYKPRSTLGLGPSGVRARGVLFSWLQAPIPCALDVHSLLTKPTSSAVHSQHTISHGRTRAFSVHRLHCVLCIGFPSHPFARTSSATTLLRAPRARWAVRSDEPLHTCFARRYRLDFHLAGSAVRGVSSSSHTTWTEIGT